MFKQFIFVTLLVCALVDANTAAPGGPADVITGALDTATNTAGGIAGGVPGGTAVSGALATVVDAAKNGVHTVDGIMGGGLPNIPLPVGGLGR